MRELDVIPPKYSLARVSENPSKVKHQKDETTIQRLFKISLKLSHRRIPSIPRDEDIV